MTEAMHVAIQQLQEQITQKQAEVNSLMQAANTLCDTIGRPHLYEIASFSAATSKRVKRSQFFNRPLATCVEEYMELMGDALTIEELYDGLISGGHVIQGKNPEYQKRTLSISLGKNPKFVKIGEAWGLAKKYGIKKAKQTGEPDTTEDVNDSRGQGDDADSSEPKEG